MRLTSLVEEMGAAVKVELDNFDPVCVAAVLKGFFRNLPEPVLSFEIYKWCIAMQGGLVLRS